MGLKASDIASRGIVNSLGGATLGSLIELIYPGIMIMWTYKASQRKDSMVTEAFSKFEGTLGGLEGPIEHTPRST